MAWEGRARGGRYYTRSKRIAGRVVREYIGAGPAGELAAALDQLDQAERQADRKAWRAELATVKAPASSVTAFGRLVDDALDLALTGAGLRNHRGEWRR